MQIKLSVTPAALLLALVTGCTTPQKIETAEPREKIELPEAVESGTPRIDVVGLQRSLGMNRSSEDLGYKEKGFNTCEAGYGYSSTHDCQRHFLAVVHFRLQCRDSEGTVSTASHILTPITSNTIKWSIRETSGVTSTNGDGFGQIVAVLPKSARKERLRIGTETKYLVQRAGDLGRLVVPRDWCE